MVTAQLFHGDCRVLLDNDLCDVTPGPHVRDVFPATGIDCIVTDPPYGVAFSSTYGKNADKREKYNQVIEDDESVEKAIASFDQTIHHLLPHMAEVCEIYVFSMWTVAPEWQLYLKSLEPLGIELRQLIIWEKGYPGIGDVKYNWGGGHEFIYYLKKGARRVPYRRSGILHVNPDYCEACKGTGSTYSASYECVCSFCGGTGLTRAALPGYIAVDKVRPGTNIHPTEKPTELLKILIEYSTVPGQFVFDPYAGSGSTLKAAKECGRESAGIEKKESYHRDASSRLVSRGLFDS